MKNLLLILFSVAALRSSAQNGTYFDSGFLFGVTSYSGDLTESIIDPKEILPGFGAYVRYNFSKTFKLRAHAYAGSIAGDDAHSESLKGRYFRFSTNIVELGLVAEYHPFGKERFSKTGLHTFRMSPYVFAGPGIAFADAETEYYGPADLRNDILKVPLPEDGLQKRFLLAPVGVGLNFDIFDYLIIGVEGGWRPVFSDDLDGVKINGNPNSPDWYYFAGTTISFILGKPRYKRR